MVHLNRYTTNKYIIREFSQYFTHEIANVSLVSTLAAMSGAAQQQRQLCFVKMVHEFGREMLSSIYPQDTHMLCYGSTRRQGTRDLSVASSALAISLVVCAVFCVFCHIFGLVGRSLTAYPLKPILSIELDRSKELVGVFHRDSRLRCFHGRMGWRVSSTLKIYEACNASWLSYEL